MSSVGRGRWGRAQDGSERLGTVYCDPNGPLYPTPHPFPSSPRMSALGTLSSSYSPQWSWALPFIRLDTMEVWAPTFVGPMRPWQLHCSSSPSSRCPAWSTQLLGHQGGIGSSDHCPLLRGLWNLFPCEGQVREELGPPHQDCIPAMCCPGASAGPHIGLLS